MMIFDLVVFDQVSAPSETLFLKSDIQLEELLIFNTFAEWNLNY